MAKNLPSNGERVNVSPGHVSLHVEGAHPPEVPFLFEQQRQRLLPAFVASAVYQVVLVTLLIVASRMGSSTAVPEPVEFYIPSETMVWLPEEGPGGGGGGGGNEMPEPPRLAELPGEDAVTVPVEQPPEPTPTPPETEEPEQIAQLNIPAATLAAATEALPGVFQAPAGPPTPSQGTGTGGGAGTGRGSGIGPGTGSGLGPGSGGGTGGGVYRPGSGVTTPRVLREVKPQYTSDAMRARVQGTVWVECVVQPTGVCTNIEIVRSLDQNFGLDQQAVRAASEWRFAPGTRLGEPVPVLVTIELTFTLR
jgi:TonB family protein